MPWLAWRSARASAGCRADNNIATLPEYLEKRYCGKARTVLAVTSLIAYVLSKLSVSVFSGATIGTREALLVFSVPTAANLEIVSTLQRM